MLVLTAVKLITLHLIIIVLPQIADISSFFVRAVDL